MPNGKKTDISGSVETYHCLKPPSQRPYFLLRADILDKLFELIAVAPHRLNDL